MTKNDDIKVGDKVVTRADHFWWYPHLAESEVVSIEQRWFAKRYIINHNGYCYKKYRWQLFKINS